MLQGVADENNPIRFLGTASKGWMAETLGVAFDRDYYFDLARRHAIDTRCNAYLRDLPGDLELFFTESNLGRLSHYRQAQVLVGGIQPNMILGMLLGADFLPRDDRDADISPTPAGNLAIVDLPPPEQLLEHALVRQFENQWWELDRQADDAWEPIPPFFWDASGRPAVHGPLTTAQKLFGDSILLDLATDPRRAQAVLDWTTDAVIALVDHFSRFARRPINEIHVGECSACMVGPEVFERWVVPTISRMGRSLGPVRLHSCGTSNHLLAACRGIENLQSLDLGGGTSIAAARELLGREMPLDIAPLIDDLLAPTPNPLLAWTDHVLQQNADGPLSIVCHVEVGFELDHLRAVRDRLTRG